MRLFYTIQYPLSVFIGRKIFKNSFLILVAPKRSIFIKVAPSIEIRFFLNKINLVSFSVRSMFFRNICTSFKNVLNDFCYGYRKHLKLQGMGYKVFKEGNSLSFVIGYSHKLYAKLLKGVFVSKLASKNTSFTIVGSSRHTVSKMVFKLLSLKVPDPYKNKGILLQGVSLIMKPGKGAYK